MKRKIIFILLIPFVIEFIISFSSCKCQCNTYYQNYAIDSLLNVNNINNAGMYANITQSDSIPKNAYGISVSMKTRTTAYNEKKSAPTFFTPAYAMGCHCDTYIYSAKDSIAVLKIFTLNDFDSNHKAGAEVSDYFKVYNSQDYSFKTIADYMQKPPKQITGGYMWELDLTLLLMTAPTNVTNQFKVQIKLADGRFFEAETSPIDLI